MSGSRPDSPHYSTARKKRVRKPIEIVLSNEASSFLLALAKREKKSRSRVIEDMLLERAERERPTPRSV